MKPTKKYVKIKKYKSKKHKENLLVEEIKTLFKF